MISTNSIPAQCGSFRPSFRSQFLHNLAAHHGWSKEATSPERCHRPNQAVTVCRHVYRKKGWVDHGPEEVHLALNGAESILQGGLDVHEFIVWVVRKVFQLLDDLLAFLVVLVQQSFAVLLPLVLQLQLRKQWKGVVEWLKGPFAVTCLAPCHNPCFEVAEVGIFMLIHGQSSLGYCMQDMIERLYWWNSFVFVGPMQHIWLDAKNMSKQLQICQAEVGSILPYVICVLNHQVLYKRMRQFQVRQECFSLSLRPHKTNPARIIND